MADERIEAVVLLDELIAAESSRFFYGISAGLWAKLKTIRLTLTRPAPKADSALVGELPDGRNYLIRKGPYWYRPHACGYTGNPHEAGRYTESAAREYSYPNGPDGPRDGIRYFHISEVDWPPLTALSDRDVVLEEAAKVVENEKVDAENSDDVMSDRAYNAACDHAAQAIRSLKGGVDE